MGVGKLAKVLIWIQNGRKLMLIKKKKKPMKTMRMMSMNFILKGRTGKRSWTLSLVSRTLVLAEEMTEDEAEAAEVDAEIVEVEAIDVVVIAKVDVEGLVESHVEKVLKLLT